MSKISRRNFLATSCLTAVAVASSSSAAQSAAKDAGESSARVARFNGTVAIFYIAHFQAVSGCGAPEWTPSSMTSMGLPNGLPWILRKIAC